MYTMITAVGRAGTKDVCYEPPLFVNQNTYWSVNSIFMNKSVKSVASKNV